MVKVITACGYVRMSTDRQDTSPEQQRAEIAEYALANGYEVTEWYEDLGVSGDKTDRRLDFQRMIAEGSTGKFDAILCWNQDRFGRFDMIEAGRWIYPLRQAGVQLVTVTDGAVDWNSMAGRLVYSVAQEGKYQYLRDLSRNVIRGMDDLARDGKWVSGKPPVGYVIGDDKRLQLGAPEDVELVREIFRRYVAGDSLREITKSLGDRGILSPKGKKWSSRGISTVLKNERYLGYMIYNQRTWSKYREGIHNPRGVIKELPRDQWLIVQNTHPAIIDRETFDAAQDMMKSNTRKTSPNPEKRNALTGILKCGECGSSCVCDRSNKKPVYTCYQYVQHPGSCERRPIDEKEGLRLILKRLRVDFFDKYLSDDNLKAVRTRIREILKGDDRPSVAVAKSHLQKIDGQLEQARRRLVEVSPDMIEHVEKRIRELEGQRDVLTHSINEDGETPQEQATSIEKRIDAMLDWINRLEQLVESNYDSRAVNHMLSQFVDRVEFDTEKYQWGPSGKRFRTRITGGRIWFKVPDLAGPILLQDNSVSLCTVDRLSEQAKGLFLVSFSLAI